MYRKLLLIAIISFSFVPFASFAENDKPVVIALAPFCDFTNLRGIQPHILQYRGNLVSGLMQNYNCIILSRCNGLALTNEKKLHAINNLEKEENNALLIPGADYAVNVYFQIGRRTAGTRGSVDIKCTMLITDLHNNDIGNFKKIEFYYENFKQEVCKEIAEALKLKPRKKKFKLHKAKIDETWAVLPLKRLESLEALKKDIDNDLSIQLELALQKSGKLKAIVDHNQIDKILQELKISNLNNSTEGAAGYVAKIIGADKVIMGQISEKIDGKDELLLDLFLVDGKTSIIVDNATCVTSKEKLSKSVSELVLDFTRRKTEIPELPDAAPEMLRKEGRMYTEILYNSPGKWVYNFPSFATNYVDSIYLLINNDNSEKFKVADFLLFGILKNGQRMADIPRGKSLEDKRKLVASIDLLYNDIEINEDTKDLLLHRAIAHIQIDNTDFAMSLVNEHMKKYPDSDLTYANAIMAGCYLAKKDYPKVFQYLEKSGQKILGISVRGWTYMLMDSPDDDEQELDNLKRYHAGCCKNTETLFIAKRIALTHKIDGVDAALNFVNKKMTAYYKPNPEIQFELAKLYYAKKDTYMAKAIMDGINNINLSKKCDYRWFRDQRWLNKLKKDIAEFDKKLTDVKINWSKIRDNIKCTEKYKIYLQPLGTEDIVLIKDIVPIVEDFTGLGVKVLPRLPLPEDPYCYFKFRNQYNSSHVWERCKVARPIPDDAFMLINISDKDMFRGRYNFIYIWWPNRTGEKTITHYKFHSLWHKDDVRTSIAKSVLGCFNIQASGRVCPIRDCLFSLYGGLRGIKEKKLAVCDKCKELYKTIDFKARKEDFHKKYNAPATYDDENKKEYQEAYNSIVTKALTEAEEAKKTISYRPAVKVNSPKKGLKYKYYEFEPKTIKKTEELVTLTPKVTGVADELDLKISQRENFFGLIFEGYIKVPKDGIYQFHLSSGGGVDIFIGDEKLMFNRGQRVKSKFGEIALKAGYHPIKVVYYFEFTPWIEDGELIKEKFVKFMEIKYRGPGILTKKIPSCVLFHEE